MAWSRKGNPVFGTNTATPPSHVAGNMIVVAAFRDGSNTPPTLPGSQNLTNVFSLTGANSCSIRISYKIATSSSETIGTHTNATHLIVCVLENANPGAFARGQANSTTFTYPALTFLENDGTSGALAFCFSRDGSTNANVDVAPSGMTLWDAGNFDATDCGAVHYVMTSTGLSSQTQSTDVTSTGYQIFMLEILDQELPANYFGYSTIGANEAGLNISTTQAGTRFDVPEDCTIEEIWVWCKSFDSASVGKTCIYSTDAGGSPIVPDVVLDNGDTFNYNQFWAWRKSKGLTYVANAAEQLYPSVAFNDVWSTKYDIGGDINQTYDKQNVAYADAFESPSTSTDRSVADITQTIIVKYSPLSSGSSPKQLALLGVG